MSPTRPPPVAATQPLNQVNQVTIKPEPEPTPAEAEHESTRTQEFDEKPTDLSMDGPTDLSSNSSRHVSIVCSPDTPNFREPQMFYMKEEEK